MQQNKKEDRPPQKIMTTLRYAVLLGLPLTAAAVLNHPIDDAECDTYEFSQAVGDRRFSHARALAQDVAHNANCAKRFQAIYRQTASADDDDDDDDGSDDNDSLTSHGTNFSETDRRPQPPPSHDPCWAWQPTDLSPLDDLWQDCCVMNAVRTAPTSCFNGHGHSYCCDLSPTTSVYLHLPILHSLALRVHIPTDDDESSSTLSYNLEQDGFLRPYDPSTTLWPTAYLLSLCLGAPRTCGIANDLEQALEQRSVLHAAVELGAGLGLPSFVLAQRLPDGMKMIATDRSTASLNLIQDNARTNCRTESLHIQPLDFGNQTALTVLAEQYGGGFSLVLGSSLMSLFDASNTIALWDVLDLLLHRRNPHALALLAHSVDDLTPLATGWERIHRISGLHFGLTTRHGDGTSDFEISVVRRAAAWSEL